MAVNMYMQITEPNIPGESKDSAHEGWIEVLTYNHGVSQPASAVVSSSGGRTVERCTHQDFSITKCMDKSTPVLNKTCCEGATIKEIIVECFRSSADGSAPVKYMAYKLEHSIISGISVGGGGGDLPIEGVTFNYGKITWTYTTQAEQAPGGIENSENISNAWDLITNTAT